MNDTSENSDKPGEWSGFETLNVVQDILDKNKLIINEINHNHELRTPDSLFRNSILIKELNQNIAKVLQQYKELTNTVMVTVDSDKR